MDRPGFAPLDRQDGYLPLAHHGLIGDGHTAALMGRDGAIPWLCVPRFDDDPLLCGILDRHRGGHFTVRLSELSEARQSYEPDTAVLVTEQRGPGGAIRITDALGVHHDTDLSEPGRSATAELVRLVEVLDGRPVVDVALTTRHRVATEPVDGGFQLRWSADPDLPLRLLSRPRLDGLRHRLRLEDGEDLALLLSWSEAPAATPSRSGARSTRPATPGGPGSRRCTTRPVRAAGAPLRHHPEAPRPHRQRRDHRRAHLLPAGGDRRRAELGLPLHLDPRRRLHRPLAAPDRHGPGGRQLSSAG
jgi:hypothetical protein